MNKIAQKKQWIKSLYANLSEIATALAQQMPEIKYGLFILAR